MSNIISISQNNSIRFVLRQPAALVRPGDYDFLLDADEHRPGVYFAPYYQPVLTTEIYTVQYRSNYTTQSAKIIARGGSVVKTITPVVARVLDDSNVMEAAFDFSGLPAGQYHCTIEGAGSGLDPFLLVSEPVEVVPTADGTVLLEWYNNEDIERIYYTTGITFRMRVRGFKRRMSPGLSMDVYTASDNDLTINEGSVVRMVTLHTYQWPDWLHELLALISIQDKLCLNGQEYKRIGEAGFDPADRYSNSQAEYTFRQQGFDFQNLSGASERVIQPLKVTVTATAGLGEITLAWGAEADVIYKIYGSQTPGVQTTLIHTTAAGVATYLHTAPGDGETWYYQVEGTRAPLVGVKSEVVSATTLEMYEIYAADPLNDNAEIG